MYDDYDPNDNEYAPLYEKYVLKPETEEEWRDNCGLSGVIQQGKDCASNSNEGNQGWQIKR